MEQDVRPTFLDKARGIAAAGMMAAGAAAVVGSLLDWVSIERPAGFIGETSSPFTGIEARDGWYVIGAGAALILLSVILTWRRKSMYGWFGFIVSIGMGVIAIADYRGIGDLTTPIARRMDIVGDAEPATGLILVAVASLIGLVSSLAGVAATPRATDD